MCKSSEEFSRVHGVSRQTRAPFMTAGSSCLTAMPTGIVLRIAVMSSLAQRNPSGPVRYPEPSVCATQSQGLRCGTLDPALRSGAMAWRRWRSAPADRTRDPRRGSADLADCRLEPGGCFPPARLDRRIGTERSARTSSVARSPLGYAEEQAQPVIHRFAAGNGTDGQSPVKVPVPVLHAGSAR